MHPRCAIKTETSHWVSLTKSKPKSEFSTSVPVFLSVVCGYWPVCILSDVCVFIHMHTWSVADVSLICVIACA